jgi:hypothetical protein
MIAPCAKFEKTYISYFDYLITNIDFLSKILKTYDSNHWTKVRINEPSHMNKINALFYDFNISLNYELINTTIENSFTEYKKTPSKYIQFKSWFESIDSLDQLSENKRFVLNYYIISNVLFADLKKYLIDGLNQFETELKKYKSQFKLIINPIKPTKTINTIINKTIDNKQDILTDLDLDLGIDLDDILDDDF